MIMVPDGPIMLMTLINVCTIGVNIVILGLAVKLYSEATKTHIFTSNKTKGI